MKKMYLQQTTSNPKTSFALCARKNRRHWFYKNKHANGTSHWSSKLKMKIKQAKPDAIKKIILYFFQPSELASRPPVLMQKGQAKTIAWMLFSSRRLLSSRAARCDWKFTDHGATKRLPQHKIQFFSITNLWLSTSVCEVMLRSNDHDASHIRAASYSNRPSVP